MNNPAIKNVLTTIFDLIRAAYSLGRTEMIRRKIPLWVAPLALVLLIGACNVVNRPSPTELATKICTKELKKRHGMVAKMRVTEAALGGDRQFVSLGVIANYGGQTHYPVCGADLKERKVFYFNEN